MKERIEYFTNKALELKQHMEIFSRLATRHAGNREEEEFLKASQQYRIEYLKTINELNIIKNMEV